jgi:2-desacetyl-2-hydroxyethyl bacteriochlorophyllide A dehydrogenase
VAAVGSGVANVRVGDRVAVDPSLPCGHCAQCRRGRLNLCLTLGALGVTVAGGAAEFMAAPASLCVVLPEHVDINGATLIEPLSCAVHGFDVLGARLGSSVVIYGAGTMGLLMLELAKTMGAMSVHVVEPNDERCARAAAFGCDAAASSVAALDVDPLFDVVIDATGNAAAISDGLQRVARGGTFLQFGVASPDTRVEIAPYRIYNEEITITGSMAVLNSFARAADLFASGLIDWTKFVTAQRPLAEYADALASFGRGEGVKTQVLP